MRIETWGRPSPVFHVGATTNRAVFCMRSLIDAQQYTRGQHVERKPYFFHQFKKRWALFLQFKSYHRDREDICRCQWMFHNLSWNHQANPHIHQQHIVWATTFRSGLPQPLSSQGWATQTETSLLKQYVAGECVDWLDDYDFPARPSPKLSWNVMSTSGLDQIDIDERPSSAPHVMVQTSKTILAIVTLTVWKLDYGRLWVSLQTKSEACKHNLC